MSIYFAYGANTNRVSMAQRCPQATPLGAAVLNDWRFCFKHCADIVPDEGKQTFGVLWDISDSDEEALDRFEGYPTYYEKQQVRVRYDGRYIRAMVYVMTNKKRSHLEPPSMYYWNTLEYGYRDFDIPLIQMDVAFDSARKAWRRRHEDLELELGFDNLDSISDFLNELQRKENA